MDFRLDTSMFFLTDWGISPVLRPKHRGFSTFATRKLRKNTIFAPSSPKDRGFPQCFPQLWKTWGRNRSCFLIAPTAVTGSPRL